MDGREAAMLKAAVRLGFLSRARARSVRGSERPLETLLADGALDESAPAILKNPRVSGHVGRERAAAVRMRIARALARKRSLPPERAESLLGEVGELFLVCDFCAKVYPAGRAPAEMRCDFCGAALPEASDDTSSTLLIETRRIGSYAIVEELGRGGMGVVYKALQESLNRFVAVKTLSDAAMLSDAGLVERFLREARIMARLSHPNIAAIYDVGRHDDFYYIVMEFIDGSTCEQMLDERGRLPEHEAVETAIPVAEALNHLYRNNLVHRDVKPSNIMLDRRSGAVKLCDLGLARECEDVAQLTQQGTVLGTPYYISPEQAEGRADIDIRADIYSLGATLYHMVTGKVPFEAASAMRVVVKHLTEPLLPPQQVLPTLSEGLSAVIEKMMRKERDRRYRNPEELLVDLRCVLRGRPPVHAFRRSGDSLVRGHAGFFEQLRTYFFARAMVGLLIGLAEADGAMEPGEIEQIKNFFREGMGADDSGVALIERLMQDSLTGDRDVESLCAECRRSSGYQERLMLLSLLYRVAAADRVFKPQEQEFIERVVELLEISATDHASVREQYVADRETEERHRRILGVSEEPTLEEVKNAYGRLVNKYDPKAMAHLGEEFVEMAKERLRQIQQAYNFYRRLLSP